MAVYSATYRADYAGAQQLGAIETFTRNNVARVVGPLGKLDVSPVNAPRFDFDPVTLACRGLLNEPASTNLCLNSEFPNGAVDNANWENVTVSAFPGFTSSMSIPAGNVRSMVYRDYPFSANTMYTFSCFVEMADGLAPVFVSAYQDDPGNDFGMILYTSVLTALPRVTHMGGKLYRVSVTVAWTNQPGNMGTRYGVLRYATNTGRAFKVTGFQLEQANAASSYIPTTTATVSRDADMTLVPGDSVLRYIKASRGTLFFDGVGGIPRGETGAGDILMALTDGTASNRIAIPRGNGGLIYGLATLGSTTLFNTSIGSSLPAGVRFKAALAYSPGYFAIGMNGQSALLSTNPTVPPFNRLTIGNGPGWAPYRGWINAWSVTAKALNLTELQEITR